MVLAGYWAANQAPLPTGVLLQDAENSACGVLADLRDSTYQKNTRRSEAQGGRVRNLAYVSILWGLLLLTSLSSTMKFGQGHRLV